MTQGTIRLVMLALCGVLQACATAEGDRDTAEARIVACFSAMDADPRLSSVNAKFARRDPSSAQLGDQNVPSNSEVEQLRLRIALTAPCRSLRRAAVKDYDPLLEPAYVALYYQADQVFDYLQQQAITYGTANRLSAAALVSFRNREQAYRTSSDRERLKAADALREEIEASHSAPPPTPELQCDWEGLNVLCR